MRHREKWSGDKRKCECFSFVNDPIYAIYVHYALLRKKLGDLVSMTALPALSGGVLAAMEFSLPPLEKQAAIVTVLSDMDAELEGLEQRRAKIVALKQAMMQELLIGRTRLV